jgi:hypothetical protein
MTAQPPDPDPAQTPDLERGGGVAPGTTPAAAPQTPSVADQQPADRRQMTPGAVLTVLAVSIFAVVFIAVAVLLVMKIVGVMG